MIATHNIKVNGRWIRAGEEYGEPEQKESVKVTEKVPETEPVKEEQKAEPKPKTTASRRKKISE